MALADYRLRHLGRKRDHGVTARLLDSQQILEDGVQIEAKALSVFEAELSHFLDDFVFHLSSPKNSSGEHISGHVYPSDWTTSRIRNLVKALLMWAAGSAPFYIFSGSTALKS